MISTLAIPGYRSLGDLVMPLGRLALVTGPNGSGKSHAGALIDTLRQQRDCWPVTLSKTLGETSVEEATGLSRPAWKWPPR